jgi:MYXO-CTERM domain-containing protein
MAPIAKTRCVSIAVSAMVLQSLTTRTLRGSYEWIHEVTMNTTRLACTFAILSLGFLAASCSDATQPAPIDTRQSAILNGSAETGWDAVGALTEVLPGQGYVGSFCTATAVASHWVLTSAACLDTNLRTPKTTFFYVGVDANPDSPSGPASGSLHAVDAFYPHASFDPQSGAHNIALAHLIEPIAGSSLPISPHSMTSSDEGVSLLWVGFGETDGSPLTGGGVKRSANMPILHVDWQAFSSQYGSTGICIGDLGGPALRQLSGNWYVVGVNASLFSPYQDPCQGSYLHMRVDAHEPWITQTMADADPSCMANPSLCHCSAACQSSGACDNTLCHVSSCSDVYDCSTGCGSSDDECLLDCYLTGTDAARAAYDGFYACATQNCSSASDLQACMQNQCASELEACFPVAVGTLTCEQVYQCVIDCSGDTACVSACHGSGTIDAQQQFDAMLTCFDDHCAGLPDDEWLACIDTSCATELEACMPSQACDLTGGDCPAGTACYPTAGGGADCVTSDDLALGAECDPAIDDHLPCGDGLICLGDGNDGTCEQFCMEDSDCSGSDVCEKPVFASLPDVGVCGPNEGQDGGVDGGAGAAGSAGSAGAGGTGGAAGSAGTGGSAAAGGTAGTGGDTADAAAGTGGTGDVGGSGGSPGSTADNSNEDDDGGCGCRVGGVSTQSSAWPWLAAGLFLLRRRIRRLS